MTLHPSVRMPARSAAVIAAVLALVAGVLLPAGPAAAAATPVPATPRGLPTAIESMGYYVGQSSCDPHVKAGTRKLATLLATTYSSYGATSWASAYACGTDGSQSEHYEGRAIDWMVSVRNARQYAAGKAAIAWLLATDAHGNAFAMARRLGIQYIIYNNRMWGAWDGRWQEYNNCQHLPARSDDNACHRTHMHLSLTWDGATGHTTFWTGKVAPIDYGPCRPADLNWAWSWGYVNRTPCRGYASVRAARGASTVKKGLISWSGARAQSGSTGPVVTALQRALHVTASGWFGSATLAAVRSFQSRHHLTANGIVTPATWRALLAATP